MPSFDSFVVGEDFVSEHFFTADTTKAGESFQSEVLKLRKQWDDTSKEGHESPLDRLRKARGQLQIDLGTLAEEPGNASRVYRSLRQALGFQGPSATFKAERSGAELLAHNVWSTPNNDVLFVEAQPADSLEDALAKDRGDLLQKPLVDDKEANYSASKLISELYQTDEAPQFIVLMAGRWLVLTERERWPEGRYLAADTLLAVERNDIKRGGELDRFLAVFGRDSLHPDANEQIWWNDVIESSVKHTVGVSKDLREGIRLSIEIIANDVLTRRTAAGKSNDDVDGQSLARQSLRFLYRILFLLYAEASPEMGVIPVGDEQYDQGYGLDRIRELVLNPLVSEKAKRGTHLYDSLNLLFTLVNKGHKPEEVEEALTFENLEADLFSPSRTKDIDEVKLSNSALQKVLDHLLLTKEARGKDRGFVSYAELGVNQLGAVYEGLMSYSGFIAQEDLHEVAKDGDSSKGSWVVPVTRSAEIDAKHFVMTQDEITGQPKPVLHEKGSFVFRLAGRERQQSASYYTPEVMTKFVVSQALEELLDPNGTTTAADDVLNITVCEPALGSGAFAIEAVRQLAAEYLERKQKELDVRIPADEYPLELQKVKAQLALHQVHGVDLNATAVELAEVSLWLDTMVAGLQAPWFGLRLRRGNSLIGARRATYSVAQVKDKSWLTSTPQDASLTGLVTALADDADDHAVVGRIHHFLLPAMGWGAAADAKEVKDLAGDAQKALGAWRKTVRLKPTKQQVDRLSNLSQRVETLWKLTLRRLEIAEAKSRRDIDYFGRTADPVIEAHETPPVSRAEIEAFLADPNSPYRRLQLVMDAWNALWFWPLYERGTQAADPPGMDEWLDVLEGVLGKPSPGGPTKGKYRLIDGQTSAMSQASWADLGAMESLDAALSKMGDVEKLAYDHEWLSECRSIADDQGFFHWEVEFAPAFGRGGFDLQIGNPPWVRPRIKREALYAEFDPWWQLKDGVSKSEESSRRADVLARPIAARFVVEETSNLVIMSAFLGDSAIFPSLTGLQPDLYRCFMEITWRAESSAGVVALVHPETHFTDDDAGALRTTCYLRLRRHWMFVNELNLFEIGNQKRYGVHIYGKPRSAVSFLHSAFNYHPDAVQRSLRHDGSGEEPGIKDDEGDWDTRPHAARIQHVVDSTLAGWHDLLDNSVGSPRSARMLYTATATSNDALVRLSTLPRVAALKPEYSPGWMSGKVGVNQVLDVEWGPCQSWSDVILQGSHIFVENPFFKTPNSTMKNQYDWVSVDLENLPEDAVPTTNLKFLKRDVIDGLYDRWSDGQSARWSYRLAWRTMAANAGVRTFMPVIIPPGATHDEVVYSAGLPHASARDLVAFAAQCGSLLSDFFVRAVPKSTIRGSAVSRIPMITEHRLMPYLLNRALRLTALTTAYAALWADVYDPVFLKDKWSGGIDYVGRSGMGDVSPAWNEKIPLRRASDRRQAELEIDAIVALMFGISVDELVRIYDGQFPVLRKYDREEYLFDPEGRLLSVEDKKRFKKGDNSKLEGQAIFLNRDDDLRQAFAHFEKLLAEKS